MRFLWVSLAATILLHRGPGLRKGQGEALVSMRRVSTMRRFAAARTVCAGPQSLFRYLHSIPAVSWLFPLL